MRLNLQLNNKGLSLLLAVFILLLASLVISFIFNILLTNNINNTSAIEGLKADFAAKSGIEWGMLQFNKHSRDCPESAVLNITQGSLQGFTVKVNCSGDSGIYTITAIASKGDYGSVDFVMRSLSVDV